jgi:hypothetical protein
MRGFLWHQRKEMRRIAQEARKTVDPVERLRFVRGRMNGLGPPERSRRRTAKRIAMIVVAIGAALLVWRIR